MIKIPRGKLTTYGALAARLGSGPRAVGQALGTNPFLVRLPCHRVVKSDGSLGGYVKGIKNKKLLLRKEGIKIKKNKIVNLKNYLVRF